MEINVVVPETSRLVKIRIYPGTTAKNVINTVVERLKLPRFDADNLRQLTYYLVILPPKDANGKEKELVPDEDIQSQVNEGSTLKLTSREADNSVLSSAHALATFKVTATWSVKELEDLLHSLRESYIALYSQNEILKDSKKTKHGYFNDRHINDRHLHISKNISSSEDLIVYRISINSPGILEVIGSLNPLETIRQYLKDRREANIEQGKNDREEKKDNTYRNAIEQAKAVLEVESLKTKVASERAIMLRDAGFPQEEIRPYIEELIEKPLEKLAVFQGNGALECSDLQVLETKGVEVIEDTETSSRSFGLPLPSRLEDDID